MSRKCDTSKEDYNLWNGLKRLFKKERPIVLAQFALSSFAQGRHLFHFEIFLIQFSFNSTFYKIIIFC